MEYYFAPMEGITGYLYRGAHHRHFHQVSRYYTPFLVPNQTRRLTSREVNDVLPEHNRGMDVVPQILTNKSEDFLWAAAKLQELGYTEVNLNLGCPSATVVTKRRGSGFLAYPWELDRFLEEVVRGLEHLGMRLSIKTRIGKVSPDEFEDLLEIYNRYPLAMLIIHPRVQTDFYKNHPHMEVFRMAAEQSKNPLCYNGDLFSAADCAAFAQEYPGVQAVMLGRGLLANPALAEQAAMLGHGLLANPALAEQAAGEDWLSDRGRKDDRERLRAFHDEVLEGYRELIGGDRNVLFKMKEFWSYFGYSFADYGSCAKKIRKAQRMGEYLAVVDALFAGHELAEKPVFRPDFTYPEG